MEIIKIKETKRQKLVESVSANRTRQWQNAARFASVTCAVASASRAKCGRPATQAQMKHAAICLRMDIVQLYACDGRPCSDESVSLL